MRHQRTTLVTLLAVLATAGCVLSRQIEITSEPPGARVWLGNQPVGQTPVRVRASATGTINTYTFNPQYVTMELLGYQREVRSLDYDWSQRNVVLSLPLILGIPGILIWGKLPNDLHVQLVRKAE